MNVLTLLLFCLIQTCNTVVLEDRFYVPGGAVPNSNYGQGVSYLFPFSGTSYTKQLVPLSAGQSLITYLRFKRTDNAIKTYTSLFFPAVDDYSQLAVPNSWHYLSTFASGATFTNVSLILYYGGRYFDLPYAGSSVNIAGVTYYVKSRTVLITLKNGILTDYKWAPTACTLTTCNCLDGMCTETCPAQNCNITLRVAFAGTDANGLQLTSYNRDIYRFENVFFLTAVSSQLGNSVYTTGGASSIPNPLTVAGTDALFVASPKTSALTIGDTQLFFLRFFAFDGDSSQTPRTYTAAYGVKVDDYAQLVVPNSMSLLVPPSTAPASLSYRNMSLLLYRTNPTTLTKTVVCALSPRRMWIHDGSFNYAVQYRGVLITLSQGIVTGCDWAPSTCIAQPNTYNLDSICAVPCSTGSCNFNITMFVAWTGTDANSGTLTSYNRDLYRLQNAFTN
ncbi:hypothetical protein HDV03_004268 [Kappamyces sp. JEL0829]|nr:hypothetical protein HDV03_004268 [Kappamyces sp. JEL0829]